jgi:hypothetical protein
LLLAKIRNLTSSWGKSAKSSTSLSKLKIAYIYYSPAYLKTPIKTLSEFTKMIFKKFTPIAMEEIRSHHSLTMSISRITDRFMSYLLRMFCPLKNKKSYLLASLCWTSITTD